MSNVKDISALSGHLPFPDGWKHMAGQEKLAFYLNRWAKLIHGAANQEVAEKYEQRARRVMDVLALKEPDQVPASMMTIGYLLNFCGVQPKDAFYNPDKVLKATIKLHQEFGLDYYALPGMYSGPMLDILNPKIVRWPGSSRSECATADGISYQYIEDEYMRADEYDELICQPEGYLLRKYLPKIFSGLEGLSTIPNIFNMAELIGYTGTLASISKGTPARAAIDMLLKAADKAVATEKLQVKASSLVAHKFGVPCLYGGHSFAPFDLIGDTMRCTMGIMTDLYRCPDKVIKATQALVPMAVQIGVQGVEKTGNPFVFMPLHKGSDIFLSQEQFKTFYWPSLKKTLLELINAGCVPILFLEGAYDKRLDVLAADPLPKGQSIWIFSQIDMKEAKKKVGPWACIAGDVPASLFKQGSLEMLESYCKNLIETCAPGGGFFLFSGAILDQANPENIHTFLNCARKYGQY